MAGRPRRMLKRLEALADAAYEIAAELSRLIPKQYWEDSQSKSEAGTCWHRAYYYSFHAFNRIRDIMDMIRAKAGIPGPFPDDEGDEDAELTDSEATEAMAGAESEDAPEAAPGESEQR